MELLLSSVASFPSQSISVFGGVCVKSDCAAEEKINQVMNAYLLLYCRA